MPIEDDLLAPDAVQRKYNKTFQPLTISLNADYKRSFIFIIANSVEKFVSQNSL